jgi:hypothetical protein
MHDDRDTARALLAQHNNESDSITERIYTAPIGKGGGFAHSLLILESVIVGVLALGDCVGYPYDRTLNGLFERVRKRRPRPIIQHPATGG